MIDLGTGVAGGSGTIIGALLSFLGFRSRLSRIEKEMDDKVSKETCQAVYKGLQVQMTTVTDLMKSQDAKIDKILEKI